jgi:hypothetical protein
MKGPFTAPPVRKLPRRWLLQTPWSWARQTKAPVQKQNAMGSNSPLRERTIRCPAEAASLPHLLILL